MTQKILAVFILVTCAIGAYLLAASGQGSKGVAIDTATTTSGLPIASEGDTKKEAEFNIIPGTDLAVAGNAKIEKVGIEEMPAIPSTPSPKYAANVSDEMKQSIESLLADMRLLIAKNVQNFDAWIQVGTLYKEAGDFAMAEKIWKFTSEMAPTNIVSPNNLADLYVHDLKDYPKAEKYYLQEIKNNPTSPMAYRELFELYTQTSYKPTNGAAEDILKKGITAVPNAIDLQVLLARYYKEQGRTDEAKAAYGAAITSAKAQGNTQLTTDLEAELAALK